MFKLLTSNSDGSASHGKFVNLIVLFVLTVVILKKVAFSGDAGVEMFGIYALYGCGIQTVNKALDVLALKWKRD